MALVFLIGSGSVGWAGDDPDGLSDQDSRINKSVVQAINSGVPIYNRGDPASCYRIYQGALVGIIPFLDSRPSLQETVKKSLASAEINGTYYDKAAQLRGTLDEIRATILLKPLWSRLGGEPAVKLVVHDFVLKAAGDPKVNFFRDNKYKLDEQGVAHLEELLVQLVSTVSGGPLKYSGRELKSSHAGMGITGEEFGAMAIDLVEILKKYRVPDREIQELVGLIAMTRKDIVEAVKPPDPKTLWARLGGEPAVKAVVHDFVDKAARDRRVNFTRGGKYSLDADGVAHLEELLVQQISAVSGGPLKYAGRDMKTTHAGMKITEEQFQAIADDLVQVLKTYSVGDKEISELMGIIATTKKEIVEAP